MTQEELDHLKILEALLLIIVDCLLLIFVMVLNLEECLLLNIGECSLPIIKEVSSEEEYQNQLVIAAITAEMYHQEMGLLLIIEDHH